MKGEEIPHEGRIVAIADVFDALTSERPYKRAWTIDEAIATMQRDSGTHFDPDLLALFIEQLPAMLEIKDKWREPV
ncbi:Cyclic di-GMP phosphodiesterase response regulator RpfG [compost metagenome]